MDEEYGTVEPGKRADLVLLGADPLQDIEHVRDIRTVVLGGTAYDRSDLDEMLRGVEAAAAALEAPE